MPILEMKQYSTPIMIKHYEILELNVTVKQCLSSYVIRSCFILILHLSVVFNSFLLIYLIFRNKVTLYI